MQGGTPHAAALGVEAFFCAGGRTLFLATYLGTWEVQNFLGSKVNFLGFLGIFLSNGRYFLGSAASERSQCVASGPTADAWAQVHSYAELVIRSMSSCLECTPVLV